MSYFTLMISKAYPSYNDKYFISQYCISTKNYYYIILTNAFLINSTLVIKTLDKIRQC